LTTLPNEDKQSFLILQPFVPVSQSDKQQNLAAFMTAKSDPENYGTLQVFVTTPGTTIDGPALVNSAINGNPQISQEETLLNQQGSKVLLGNVITVPINQSLIYVQPLYVQAQNPVPRLEDVLIVYQGKAVHGGTLNSALCQLPFGQVFCTLPGGTAPPPSQFLNNSGGNPGSSTTTPPSTPAPSTPGSTPPANATVQSLLADAKTHFDNANNALKNQDFATYGKEIQLAQNDVVQAQKLLAAGTTPPSSSSSTSSTPPSTTPSSSSSTTASALGAPRRGG
jgi:uncharacterized membrane protein (UPF0182 family)